MKVYKWLGTAAEAAAVLGNLKDESVVQLKNEDETLVLQETDKPVIAYTEMYEVLDQTGTLRNNCFAVLNNIPVTEEGKALFEQRFQKRAKLIEQEPGFIAIRVLRPLTTDTYIILTMWESEANFTGWQESQAYSKAHAKRGTDKGIDKRPNILARPSFVTTYH